MKKCGFRKNIGYQKSWVPKKLGTKKFGYRKDLGTEKIWVPKEYGYQKLSYSKSSWVQNDFGY